MGELGGFIRVHRVGFDKRDPAERIRDYKRALAELAAEGAEATT